METPPYAPGRTRDQLMAQVAADGIFGNARSLVSFGEPTFGELSLTDCAKVLKVTAQGLNDGDLSAAVTMLAAQAVALNAMFGELARVGQANMFKAPDYADRYLRLAFKAQGQSRATLETLAVIKNPPVVFAPPLFTCCCPPLLMLACRAKSTGGFLMTASVSNVARL